MAIVTEVKEGYSVAFDLETNLALIFRSGYLFLSDLVAAPKEVLEEIMRGKDNKLPIVPVTDNAVHELMKKSSMGIRYVNSLEEYDKL